MAKKYQSGVYLGETRRQRTARIRNFGIIAALILLTILASVFFVSWLLDRADALPTEHPFGSSVGEQTDAAETEDSAQTADTAADTQEDTAFPQDTQQTTAVVPDSAAAITGTPYKPLSYTDTWSVMLDPGHGFDDIGTSSALLGQVNEATVNLDIALRVREILSAYPEISVMMTHDDNTVDGRVSAAEGGEPPLNHLVLLTPEDRAVLANGQDIDLFVSVHCDSLPDNPAVSGMRVYYYDGGEQETVRNSGAEALATNLANTFGLAFGTAAPTPLVKTMSDDDAFYVIKKIGVPSVLCEVGFVTNEADAANMLDAEWRQTAAQGIADGILAYIGA